MVKASEGVKISPVNICRIGFWVVGISPLIVHAWGPKSLQMMRDKHQGKKTKTREARDPEKEAEEAAYRMKDGRYAIPGMGFKNAVVSAAHNDLGVPKTLVRKSLFLRTDNPQNLVPLEIGDGDPVIREDTVRVGTGTTDLRYRPMFTEWSFYVEFDVDGDLLTPEDILTLVDRAGFGIGLCEWRPEKNGEYGRFEIDRSKPVATKGWKEKYGQETEKTDNQSNGLAVRGPNKGNRSGSSRKSSAKTASKRTARS